MDNALDIPTMEDSKFEEARKAEKMDEFIENLCAKLRCSELADDLEKLAIARHLLQKLQYKSVIERVLPPEELLHDDEHHLETAEILNLEENENIPEIAEEEGECNVAELVVDLPEDAWHGFFKGFQILSEYDDCSVWENKKCIEINPRTCATMLETYIRAGVRCFCIDLFIGTELENQQLIVRLRESELMISKEYNFPIASTLFAKLSPRLQFTGDLDYDLMAQGKQTEFVLTKDDDVILTIERIYSMRCYRKRIYVNASFLLVDIQDCDFICIGPDIQLRVKHITETSLRCQIVIGGVLESRMPVLFPSRCNKVRVSLEELEGITFAKEVGIGVIVSYIIGGKEYFDDLKQILQYFRADNMRLCARVILNDLKGCDAEYMWAAEGYDGFIMELCAPKRNSQSNPTFNQTEMLHICPAADNFLQRAFHLKKPIIFDPALIVNRQYNVDPEHYFHIFYYPDKYIFKCADMKKSFYFFYLQNALFCEMPRMTLSDLPYCDESFANTDSLARSAVAAAYEMDAKCIFVRGVTGRMARKLAHFRPKVPIIFLTHLKSITDHICIFHNIIVLHYARVQNMNYRRATFKQLLFGLLYAKSRKIISHKDNVIIVYNSEAEHRLQDKYVSFKFDQKNFPIHLQNII